MNDRTQSWLNPISAAHGKKYVTYLNFYNHKNSAG
jgi:hypothetical protein